jgi:hypothetical protein
MDSTLMRRLEHAGGSGILPASATLQERLALSLHLVALKKAGHAVVADEVYESGGMDDHGELRIIHYRTCTACKKVRHA